MCAAVSRMVLPDWAELVGLNAALLVSALLLYLFPAHSCTVPSPRDAGGRRCKLGLGPSFDFFFFFFKAAILFFKISFPSSDTVDSNLTSSLRYLSN